MMNPKPHRLLLPLVVLALLGGCDKKPQESTSVSGASTGAAAASAAASAAAPAPRKCADGEWSAPKGTFCIKLPAGWKAAEPKELPNVGGTQTSIYISNPDNHDAYIDVYYRDTGKGDYEAGLGNLETDAKAGGGKFEDQGNARSGTGAYRVYMDVNHSYQCKMLLLKDAKTFIHIGVQSMKKDEKLPADLIEACKSAYVP